MSTLSSVRLWRLWRLYVKTRDLEARNELVLRYRELVEKAAKRKYRSLSGKQKIMCGYSDLCAQGMMGLIRAVEKFTPRSGASFETYSYKKIEGAMLDEMRSLSWIKRRTRANQSRFEKSRQDFFARCGRYPTYEEICGLLKVTPRKLQKIYLKNMPVRVLDISNILNVSNGDQGLGFDENEKKLLIEEVMVHLASLLNSERYTVICYYLRSLGDGDIARERCDSQSNIRSLRFRAIRKLHSLLVLNRTYSRAKSAA